MSKYEEKLVTAKENIDKAYSSSFPVCVIYFVKALQFVIDHVGDSNLTSMLQMDLESTWVKTANISPRSVLVK